MGGGQGGDGQAPDSAQAPSTRGASLSITGGETNARLSEDRRAHAQQESRPGMARAKRRVHALSQRGRNVSDEVLDVSAPAAGEGTVVAGALGGGPGTLFGSRRLLTLLFCELQGSPALPRLSPKWSLGTGERFTMIWVKKAKTLLEGLTHSSKFNCFDRNLEKVLEAKARFLTKGKKAPFLVRG